MPKIRRTVHYRAEAEAEEESRKSASDTNESKWWNQVSLSSVVSLENQDAPALPSQPESRSGFIEETGELNENDFLEEPKLVIDENPPAHLELAWDLSKTKNLEGIFFLKKKTFMY